MHFISVLENSLCKLLLFKYFNLILITFLNQSQTALEQVQKCEQKIQYNRVLSTSCLEKHVLRPFSNENDGATTTVKQSLEYSYSSRIRASEFFEIQVTTYKYILCFALK